MRYASGDYAWSVIGPSSGFSAGWLVSILGEDWPAIPGVLERRESGARV